MLNKLSLYWHTIRYLKIKQIYYRILKKLGLHCSHGVYLLKKQRTENIFIVNTIEELDFDPVFLSRFSADSLLSDKITFLHDDEVFQWYSCWYFPEHSELWNYNLHYFEFIFVLLNAFKKENDEIYLDKIKECISGWIAENPRGRGVGWNPYTIALRLANWISVYKTLCSYLQNDSIFEKKMLDSMYQQYTHLSMHLEKDLLGNHYLEELKTLLLCALFFNDSKMLHKSIRVLKKQCREQILPDGMHFELSPMYHKIILEDLLLINVALRSAGQPDEELESYLQPMLNVAYSFENETFRIPLFNDSGNNISKSLDALLTTAKKYFGLTPYLKNQMPDSGYYIFTYGIWKLIVDAGKPGPNYIPGHSHCDGMSFELFKNGKPIIVNCGTYAYQCKERIFFRSTSAHNTVMIDRTEQSQCWGNFRLAKRASITLLNINKHTISMKLVDQNGGCVKRTICFDNKRLKITDISDKGKLSAFLHFDTDVVEIKNKIWRIPKVGICHIDADYIQMTQMDYAPEYGYKSKIKTLVLNGFEKVGCCICFDE